MRKQEGSDTTFSRRLRVALAEQDTTREAVARELDVSLRAVQAWVAGESEPKGHRLVELGRTLGRDPAWFYEEEKAA